MKKFVVVLGLVAILVPVPGYSEQGKIASIVDKILGKGKDDSTTTEQGSASKKKRKYVIRLRSGGKIETDNYEMLKGTVRIMLPAGAITLQQNEIRDIQEVSDDEAVTVQKSFAPTPAPGSKAGRREESITAPPRPIEGGEMTDNEGHNQYYWKSQMDEWKKKYDDAAAKYKAANDDWNRYNGLLQTVSGGTASISTPGGNTTITGSGKISDYQAQQYLDLRGAARVKMDEAQKEMDEADRMVNQVIPDEARKAGAPPGWVR